jgi:GT2 family glycosyltransferase
MNLKVAVVVVNYNGLADTQRCLRSLRNLSTQGVFTVVVDNASTEDPCPILQADFPEFHYVRNSRNEGWAGGNNTGIRVALEWGADQVILLNNDTEVHPNLVERLLATAAAHPDYGILGPVINFLEEPGTLMTDGCTFNEPGYNGFFQRKPVPVAPDGLAGVTEVDIVNGCCMMIGGSVFRKIGLVDERFFLIHEESDFCLRARHAGFRCGVLGEVLVWHKGSSSFKRTGKQIQRYYDARNLYLLLRKHTTRSGRRRGPWPSRLTYLKYVYYRYSIERENGQPEAADAVLRGVLDAISGRYGPAVTIHRPGLGVLRSLFELVRRRRAGARR